MTLSTPRRRRRRGLLWLLPIDLTRRRRRRQTSGVDFQRNKLLEEPLADAGGLWRGVGWERPQLSELTVQLVGDDEEDRSLIAFVAAAEKPRRRRLRRLQGIRRRRRIERRDVALSTTIRHCQRAQLAAKRVLQTPPYGQRLVRREYVDVPPCTALGTPERRDGRVREGGIG